ALGAHVQLDIAGLWSAAAHLELADALPVDLYRAARDRGPQRGCAYTALLREVCALLCLLAVLTGERVIELAMCFRDPAGVVEVVEDAAGAALDLQLEVRLGHV